MKTNIAKFILLAAITISSVFGQNPNKEEFTETAMIFWTVCNSVPLFETMNDHPPKTSNELINFLEEAGKDNEGLRKWVAALKSGNLVVFDQDTIGASDPYITFQAEGEKDIYILLKNGKVEKEKKR